MPNILIICTANICRSPVAERLLLDRFHQQNLPDWQVRSVGTWAEVTRGASRYSIRVMAEHGFDLLDHQSRMVEAAHLQEADLILCMETGHVEALKSEFPAYNHKIYLISEMIGKRYNISDPYGQDIHAYRTMYHELTMIIDGGLDKIIKLAAENKAKQG